jgi:hypothetical protein
MRKFCTLALGCGLLSALAGCAAREVHPVSLSQAGDDQLTCEQLREEVRKNQDSATILMGKQKSTNGKNVAKSIAPIPYLGILLAASADFSQEDQIKARSMLDRNEKLNYLLKKKGC